MGFKLAGWPFSRSKARQDAARLVATVSQISRQPSFFGSDRVSDTLEGRLEVVMLHASLAFIRLRREPQLEPLAQAFADAQFRHFDDGLREAGVGDLSVSKRMHKIAGDFYGRLDVYAAALGQADREALTDAISRNVLGTSESPFASVLSAYVADTAAKQAAAPAERLFFLDGWSQSPP